VLDKNGLTDVGAARVADMFMTCPRLKRLSLAQNDNMQEVARICEKSSSERGPSGRISEREHPFANCAAARGS